MSNSLVKKRLPPLSIRLSAGEREALTARAGDLPLSTYVKRILLADDAPVFRKSPRPAPVDRELLGRVLAKLGASRIGSNLAQIAKHANLGTLPVDETLQADLQAACAHVTEIRSLLMQALGKEPPHRNVHDLLARVFNIASSSGEVE